MQHKGTYSGAIDGIWGKKSEAAYQALFPQIESSNIQPPNADFYSVKRVFGAPGNESNLVTFTFPYLMVLAWDKRTMVKRSRCHKLIKEPLVAALQELLDTYGTAWIKQHGLHLFGGIYNFRKTRGGKSTSKHSWGIAIDLNPDSNGNRVPWPSKATMPIEAIKIFEKHGFKSAARAWGRDAMHFQYTK